MCYQQADTDTLRLRLHRQLAPPGSLSVLACHRWRQSAAHPVRSPCNGQVSRYSEGLHAKELDVRNHNRDHLQASQYNSKTTTLSI